MKRILFLIVFVMALLLSSCTKIDTYDDLLNEYSSFLSQHENDYKEHINYLNQLSMETIQSVVFVKKTVNIASSSSSGTGVVIHEDGSYYYILTNHHVTFVENPTRLTRVTYEIFDYQNVGFQATLVHSNPSYDLAVLRVQKTARTLRVAQTVQKNPDSLVSIAVIGYPGFQKNAITMGKILSYGPVEIINPKDPSINIAFDVIISDAPVRSGSSGSPMFGPNHQLLGLVYAGNFTSASGFSRTTYAIPIEKIYEYLISINIILGGAQS